MFLALILLYSCSSEKTQREEKTKDLEEIFIQDLKLEVNEIYCWINAMPGSESRFHITGDLNLLDDLRYDYLFVKLSKIIVMQANTEIYSISPVIQENDFPVESPYKNIKFSTIRGLLINRDLDDTSTINLRLVFKDGSEELEYELDDITINKVF